MGSPASCTCGVRIPSLIHRLLLNFQCGRNCLCHAKCSCGLKEINCQISHDAYIQSRVLGSKEVYALDCTTCLLGSRTKSFISLRFSCIEVRHLTWAGFSSDFPGVCLQIDPGAVDFFRNSTLHCTVCLGFTFCPAFTEKVKCSRSLGTIGSRPILYSCHKTCISTDYVTLRVRLHM